MFWRWTNWGCHWLSKEHPLPLIFTFNTPWYFICSKKAFSICLYTKPIIHWQAMKHILCYLLGAQNFGIYLSKVNKFSTWMHTAMLIVGEIQLTGRAKLGIRSTWIAQNWNVESWLETVYHLFIESSFSEHIYRLMIQKLYSWIVWNGPSLIFHLLVLESRLPKEERNLFVLWQGPLHLLMKI